MTRALLVFAGFLIAGAVSFAQVGGRGRNVQFVDGATISPTSVQASGTADQFVCTSTTATCEVESSASATTMTSTVPAFDIGPTATPGTNDKLACFSYGPSGSKTRTACVDAEGDINARVFQSTALAAGTGFACTNVGCRLSLGNTGRYFVDDGTNLEAVAPLQATTFNATDATNASALFSGGSATNAMYFQSNTTDAFTQLNTGQESAFVFKASENINDNDIIMSVLKSNNGIVSYLQESGQATFSGAVRSGLGIFGSDSNITVAMQASPADSASAVAIVLRSLANFTTAGAKLVSVRNNNTSEVSFIDYLGNLSGNSYAATATSGSSFTGGNSSTTMTLTSNTPDSVTSGTVPAIRLQASQDITNTDLLMSVEDSAGNRRMTLREDGVASFAGSVTSSGQFTSASQYETTFGFFNASGVTANLVSNVSGTTTAVALASTINKTGDTTRLVSVRNNTTTEVAYFSKDGLLRVNQANAAKPTCNADNRGRLYFLDGGAGVADIMEVCMKDSADVYAWETVASP